MPSRDKLKFKAVPLITAKTFYRFRLICTVLYFRRKSSHGELHENVGAKIPADDVASNGGVTSASPPVNDNNVVSALTSTSSSGEIVSKSEKDFDDVSSLVRELRHSGVYRNFFCEQ